MANDNINNLKLALQNVINIHKENLVDLGTDREGRLRDAIDRMCKYGYIVSSELHEAGDSYLNDVAYSIDGLLTRYENNQLIAYGLLSELYVRSESLKLIKKVEAQIERVPDKLRTRPMQEKSELSADSALPALSTSKYPKLSALVGEELVEIGLCFPKAPFATAFLIRRTIEKILAKLLIQRGFGSDLEQLKQQRKGLKGIILLAESKSILSSQERETLMQIKFIGDLSAHEFLTAIIDKQVILSTYMVFIPILKTFETAL